MGIIDGSPEQLLYFRARHGGLDFEDMGVLIKRPCGSLALGAVGIDGG